MNIDKFYDYCEKHTKTEIYPCESGLFQVVSYYKGIPTESYWCDNADGSRMRTRVSGKSMLTTMIVDYYADEKEGDKR